MTYRTREKCSLNTSQDILYINNALYMWYTYIHMCMYNKIMTVIKTYVIS